MIFHFSSVVSDDKSIFLALRLFIERIFFVNVVKFVQEILVAATGKAEKRQKFKKILKNLNFFISYLHESSKMHNSPVGFDSNR